MQYEDDNKADHNDDNNYNEDGAMTNMKRPNFSTKMTMKATRVRRLRTKYDKDNDTRTTIPTKLGILT